MYVIGVTGGVGSGKTAVLNALKEKLSCVVLYADDAAKEIEKKGHKCYDRLVEALGTDILDADGEIDKKRMAEKIFGNDELLLKVNGIIHPEVKEYILERIEEEKSKGQAEYFFLEAALLIECGYLGITDEMWYVYADAKTRKERLKKARGYSDEKIESIMKSQLSEEEFRKSCDYVIDNSGSIASSIRQIEEHINNGKACIRS